MNSHFIQTYYRLDVGCKLEFCDPTQGYPGVSQQFGIMNRSYRVNKQGRFEVQANPYAYDVVNCQHYVYGPARYFTKWPTVDSPCEYHWPPNTKPTSHPVLSTQRERTIRGYPLSYISEDGTIITTLDADTLGEGNEGFISETFTGNDIEMTPSHNFAPSTASADHDGQADLAPVSEDEYILSIVN